MLNLLLCSFIKSTITGTYAIELVDSDNSHAVTKTYTVDSANTWEKKTITFPEYNVEHLLMTIMQVCSYNGV